MAHHLTKKRGSGDARELAHIENQKLDPLDRAVIDQAAGFEGRRKDAVVEMRAQSNLVKAVRRYATLQAKAIRQAKKEGKDTRIASVEDLLKRGKFLRQRLIEYARKVNIDLPGRVIFPLDEMAEPQIATFVRGVIQPEVLALAFQLHGRPAPSKFHYGYDVVFASRREAPREQKAQAELPAPPSAT